jgi:hypothetical protein
MRPFSLALVLTLACALPGCELGEGPPDDDGDTTPSSAAEICERYKLTYCSFLFECNRSGLSTRACLDQYAPVVCRPGRLAADCDALLRRTSCLSSVPECEIARVADRTVPEGVCQAVHEANCRARERCGEAHEACMNDVTHAFPCEAVIGVYRDPQDCLDAFEQSPCDPSRQLPAECLGLFVVAG